MKNADQWLPSKYVYRRGKLVASRDPNEVAVSTRLIADLVARLYDQHIQDHCTGKLIDLGCGKVPLFQTYRHLVESCTCVDWPNTPHKNDFVDHECDLTRPLPFADGEFRTIILSDVLEHVPTPELLWHEMSRILAGGGKILMNVPFYYWLHEQPHDYYRYTEHALRRFAELAGLKVLVLETLGGSAEVLADLLAKHFMVIPAVGKPLAISVQAVARFFSATTLGKRLAKESGKRFPLGYFMVAEKIGPMNNV